MFYILLLPRYLGISGQGMQFSLRAKEWGKREDDPGPNPEGTPTCKHCVLEEFLAIQKEEHSSRGAGSIISQK